MRYLTSRYAFREGFEIGAATGALPPTYLRPAIEDHTVLTLEPIRFFACGGMVLALADRTASWCLLERDELAIAVAAKDVSFATLTAEFADVPAEQLREFFVKLYQRGLLRLNGRPGLDPSLLGQGALYRDANLVEILVTQKCNLACLYCLAEAGPDMPHMHPEVAYRAVDAAFALPGERPLTIQLSGGEPFVNVKLFKKLVAYIEQKREETGRPATVCTQSNGTLVTDEVAEFVKEHEIGIGISCDGPAELNNRSRPTLGGQASHHRTLRGIKTLQRHGIKFGTILVLNRTNVGHPREIADFFVELGVPSTKINPINMIGDAQSTWDRMAITNEQYFDFLQAFIDHLVENRLPLKEANLSEYLKYLVRRTHDYRCMRSNCGAGKSFFLVDASGDVYPCAHSAGIPAWRLGKVEEASHGFVSLGERHPIVGREFARRLVDLIPQTRPCPWRHFCEGGCAVNAYQKFGSITAPDTLCGFYERMYPRLFERIAAAPDAFQALLDTMLGVGQVTVTSFSIDPSATRRPRLQAPIENLDHRYHEQTEIEAVATPTTAAS